MSIPRAVTLSFLVARDAPFAVIARRGPSKRTCLIGWNIRKGTFETGHWFKGTVALCDLSPDGEWLITVCHKYYGDWTVLSKPPYLTAHALWHQPFGATFSSNTGIVLSWKTEHGGMDNAGPYRLPSAMKVRQRNAVDDARPADPFRWHWVPGSRFKPNRFEIASDFNNGTAVDGRDGLRLQRNLLDRTRLVDGTGQPLAVFPKSAEAIDFNPWGDHAGIVFAIGGRLHALPLAKPRVLPDEEALMAASIELADFTGLAFETKPAPDWARPAGRLDQRPRPDPAKPPRGWDPVEAEGAMKRRK